MTTGDEHDQQLAQEVNRTQLKRIYSQNLNAFIGQPLAGIVALSIVWSAVASWKLLLWFGIMILLQFARFVNSLRFAKEPEPLTAERAKYWGNAHVFFMTLTAILWVVGMVFMLPDEAHFQQMVMLFVVVVTVAAALVGHTFHRPSYIAYTLTSLVPIALWFMLRGDADFVMLGVGCLLTVGMLLRIADRSNRASTDAEIVGIRFREQANVLAEEKSKTEALKSSTHRASNGTPGK